VPEGDTIRNHVTRLGPRMVGHTILEARSRWPSAAFGLRGRTVERLEPQGKNLWIVLDDGNAVRVHLGMRGRWRWQDEPYEGSLGQVSLLLVFDHGVAICTGAPTVERLPAKVLDAPRGDGDLVHPTRELGPDVLADDFDVEEVLPRIAASGAATAAEVLLDQRVACGIGNVYKSEALFLCRIHPFDPPEAVDPDTWRAAYATARELMSANLRPGPRITAPTSARTRHWVYGRAGRPCLRCGTTIECRLSGGGLPRHTWWCPTCSRPRSGR
jgi:endonuclease VIII